MSLYEASELKKGMVRQKHLKCDCCGKRYYFCFEITTPLRSYLKEFPMYYPENWKFRDNGNNRIDLCPKCAEKKSSLLNPMLECC